MQLTSSDINQLIRITHEAGKRILPYFRAEHGVRRKEDRSPVTDADMAAHDYILEQLTRLFPQIPVISEEDPAPPTLTPDAPFFLVDPLDGTRSFVRGEDEFTVNIGLLNESLPVFGVVGSPVHDVLYYGGTAMPAQRVRNNQAPESIRVRPAPAQGLVLTRSRSAPSARAKAYMEKLSLAKVIPASSSVKFCWIAEGDADLYPRFGRTMEWDTAAGHAVLNAAGGRVTTAEGAPLTYGKPGFENPGFIACGA